MTPPKISRRAFLAAGALVVVATPATACAASTPTPTPTSTPTSTSTPTATTTRPTPSAVRQSVTIRQGNASVTVSLTPIQDVTAIDYTITDVGSVPDTFTVSTTDLNDGRTSRTVSYKLDPGDSASGEMYGRLNHSFQLNVCQSDGTCFTVGPVGPAPQVGGPARGLTAGPNQPGPTP